MLTGQIFNKIDLKSLIIDTLGYLLRLKTLTSFVMSPKVNRMDPIPQLIMALAVVRNGHPKMIGV